jgi:WD40 repeat protein
MKRVLKIFLSVAVIIVVFLASYFYFKPREENIPSEKFKPDVSFVSTKLATIPEQYISTFRNVAFSPDGRNVAYVAKSTAKELVFFGDSTGKLYDRIGYPIFSSDGRLFAYSAVTGEQSRAVVNNQEDPPHDSVMNDIAFAPDSHNVIYTATDNGKARLVVNGVEGKTYDRIDDLVFSPNGERFAYAARKNNNVLVVEGATEGKSYLAVENLKFSPDSKNLYYAGYRSKVYPQQEETLVTNGVEGKWYSAIGHYVITKDNKIVMMAKQGDETFIVTDGKEGQRYERGGGYFALSGLVVSPDGKKFGFTVNVQNNTYFVLGDQKEKEYQGIRELTFSPDSNTHAYIASQNKESFAVVNGKEGKKRADSLAQIYIGAENKIVYRALEAGSNGRYFVSINDVDGRVYDDVTGIAFFPQTNHVVYIGREGKKNFLIVDGKERGVFDWIDERSFKFSEDGKKVAFGAQKGNEFWWIVENI